MIRWWVMDEGCRSCHRPLPHEAGATLVECPWCGTQVTDFLLAALALDGGKRDGRLRSVDPGVD